MRHKWELVGEIQISSQEQKFKFCSEKLKKKTRLLFVFGKWEQFFKTESFWVESASNINGRVGNHIFIFVRQKHHICPRKISYLCEKALYLSKKTIIFVQETIIFAHEKYHINARKQAHLSKKEIILVPKNEKILVPKKVTIFVPKKSNHICARNQSYFCEKSISVPWLCLTLLSFTLGEKLDPATKQDQQGLLMESYEFLLYGVVW